MKRPGKRRVNNAGDKNRANSRPDGEKERNRLISQRNGDRADKRGEDSKRGGYVVRTYVYSVKELRLAVDWSE